MEIKESLEMIEFVDGVVDDLAAGKSMAQVVIENLPAGVSALMGADKIDDELKELSDEEKNELLSKAMPVLQKLAKLAMQ